MSVNLAHDQSGRQSTATAFPFNVHRLGQEDGWITAGVDAHALITLIWGEPELKKKKIGTLGLCVWSVPMTFGIAIKNIKAGAKSKI